MCSVVELRENIVDSVIDLGVSLDFLENPAFVATLSEIDTLIGKMNIEDAGVVLVDESNDTLSFKYTNVAGDKFSFELSCPDENTIKAVKVEEPHTYVGDEGKVVRKKNVVEHVATLGSHGEVTVVVNTGAIDNLGCDNHHYNMTNTVERRVYTKRGVMYERENKSYAARKGEGYFHRVGVNEMLLLARQAFDYAPWSDIYNRRTLLRREMLDTARLVFEDRAKENNYYGVVPLHKENSLRDLCIAKDYNVFPMIDVEIEPLSEEEIEELLAKEVCDKVAEGLGYFAQGRTSYRYSSVENEA